MTVKPSTLVPLGEVLDLAMDPHPVGVNKIYANLGIYSFGKGLFKKLPISGSTTSARSLYRLRSGQIVYSRLFAFEGAYAVVPPEFDGAYVSNEFPSFEVRTARALPGYVGWFLKRPETWRALAMLGTGMGDRRQRIHPAQLLSFSIPLPPLSGQDAIVSRLDAAEACVAKRATLASAIQAECDALLHSAFARSVEGASTSLMGRIAPLVRRAVAIKADRAYTEIGVRSFFKGTFHRRTLSGSDFTWQKLFEIREGDLVFSNLMAWEKGIALAQSDDAGCVGNHRMLTCEVDRAVAIPEFLWFYFTTPAGFAQVLSASPGSIARNKTLSAEDLPRISVPLPSLDVQKRFCKLLRKVGDVRVAQAEAARELDLLVPALLHKAFGTTQASAVA